MPGSAHRLACLSLVIATGVGVMTIGGCPTSASLGDLANGDSAKGDSANRDLVNSAMSGADSLPDLGSRIDQVLAANLQSRQLDVTLHGAWQVLHGVLAYGAEFQVKTPSGSRPAIAYLLEGNRLEGFQPQAGDTFTSDDLISEKSIGLRFAFEPSTKMGQGHRDQWLAVLAQSGVMPKTLIRSSGRDHRWIDVVRQTEHDIPMNLEEEFSWTLIGLLAYRGTDHTWTARDGREYSIELLLEVELSQPIESSVCGGTHRLNAIAMAIAKRRAENRPIVGVWARAQQQLESSIADAKRNQNPDGSYSLAYMHRSGWARDLSEQLGTTGHVLEFVALAADDATLNSSWVKRSAHRICDLLEQCDEVDLECGVLYHAIHGLQEYRSRVKTSL